MRVIKCARCGEDVFTTGPRTKYCLACATQVRIENQKKRRACGLKDGTPYTKHITCAICGKDVVVSTKASRAKFCPECSARAYKASAKKYKDKEKRWMLAEPRKIHCERCGCEVILTDARSFNRKYCDACKKIVYVELTKKAHDAYRERKNPGVKRCARCGVVLENRRSNQKYCDDCRAAAKFEKEAARKRRQREGWRTDELPEKKKKKPRVSQIEKLNAAARKAGMSYGKYVAMLAMKKGKKVRA